MSDKPGLALKLNNAADELVLSIEGKPSHAMSAKGLDNLIRALMAVRCKMLPRQPTGTPQPDTEILSRPDMNWWVQPHPKEPGAVLLCLRLPGLGWVGITLFQKNAKRLAELILTLTPPPGGPRPN